MHRSPQEEGKRWLDQALEDMDAARYNLAGDKFYLVCFLCQQLSEKAIKAFLYSRGEEIVLGHSVVCLCEYASRYDSGFSELRREVGSLDGYYIPTRYPNGLPDGIPARAYAQKDALSALRAAEQVVSFVRQRMQAP